MAKQIFNMWFADGASFIYAITFIGVVALLAFGAVDIIKIIKEKIRNAKNNKRGN